jgi:hypothetical protein
VLDTKALADATALVVRDAVDRAVTPLLARIAALEAREPLQGEPGAAGKDAELPDIDAMIARAVSALPPPRDGTPGADGKDGADGAGIADLLIDRDGCLVCTMTDGRMKSLGIVIGKDGMDGAPGADGRDGADGAPGRDGIDGKDGADGEPGPAGRDGVDGKDGADGAPGRDGIDGKDGEPGLPGADGKDGIDGAPGKDGADGADGRDGIDGKDAYPGEARGLFDPEAVYRALDVVSFNGSEWRAKCDNPGDLPGENWMLSASRGKRGDRGEQGLQGKAGATGASLIAGYVDTHDMKLTLTRDDGSEVEVDLYDLATVIRAS